MRKNILLFLLLAVSFYSIQLKAQVWDTVTKFNQVINDLQTFDGKLFIGGGFTKNETNTCYWSAYYSNHTITPQLSLIGGTGIRKLSVLNGLDLYAADALQHSSSMGVGLWDGSAWIDGGSTNYSHGVVYGDGNDLYVSSDDGKVRKKTGSGSFTSFYNFNSPDGLSCIFRYNSLLIFAGTFTTVGGVPANNIAAWNGTTWQALGSGVTGGVRCMAVFNNELYVAGGVTSAGGNTVTNIAKWNGTSWSAVGGGVSGTCFNGIRDMKAFGPQLYVAGDFMKMGSVTTGNVAKWNGTQWQGLGLTHTDAFVNCVEIYNNELYAGTFDFNHSHLFHFSGALGINEINIPRDISIYPNPACGQLQIEFTGEQSSESDLIINNINGEKIYQINPQIRVDGKMNIDLSSIPKGIYFLQLKNEQGVIRKKIVLQ